MLDEPFGALDPGITADMHALILKLWNANKMTIFMVTHDLQESFELGTRLLVFDKVRIDPQAPEAFGATITYNIPLRGHRDTPVDAGVPGAAGAAGVAGAAGAAGAEAMSGGAT